MAWRRVEKRMGVEVGDVASRIRDRLPRICWYPEQVAVRRVAMVMQVEGERARRQ